MKFILPSSALAVILLAGCSSLQGGAGKEADEHAAHHPPATAAKVDDARFEQQMKAMHEMHEKMHAAKTPEERAALMKEHMKTMHDGMAMMGQMRGGKGMGGDKGTMGGGMHMDGDTMKRRMDMMEMMMQMMMDREGMKTPAAK